MGHNLFQSLNWLIFKDFYVENDGLRVAEFTPAWEKI